MEKYILIVVGIFLIWLLLNFAILLIRKTTTHNTFKKLEKLLKKRYVLLNKIELKTDSLRYLKELESLPEGIKYLNRKLDLNYIISQDLLKNYNENIFSDEYKILDSEIRHIGNIYNNKATHLKTSVEIFPTALMARFMNIKTVDFYRG